MDMICRSGPAIDMTPTLKTRNTRICILLGQKDQRMGMLTLHDAERLQVAFPLPSVMNSCLSPGALLLLLFLCSDCDEGVNRSTEIAP